MVWYLLCCGEKTKQQIQNVKINKQNVDLIQCLW